MQKIYKTFDRYVNNYDKNNDGVIMKYNHSLRVAKISKKNSNNFRIIRRRYLIS